MTIKGKINAACRLSGVSTAELAMKFGTSKSNLEGRLKTGKFTQEEYQQLADILGCKFNLYFDFPEVDVKKKIMSACAMAGITPAELARRIGMNPNNFIKRLNNGKFTQEEYRQMADAMGCRFEMSFEYPDGTRL